MSDCFFDSDPEYPRKGFYRQTEEQQREEIQRKINKNVGWENVPWVAVQAKRFGIIRQEIDNTLGY